MSKSERRRRQAAKRGVYAFRVTKEEAVIWGERLKPGWTTYADGGWAPDDLGTTKREAINLAYQIAVSKKPKLEVTYA